jgi:hypothetical protein
MMAPKQGVTPRRRSGSLYRFEPSDTSLIEQNPDHVNSFKRMGCWRYCQKLEGHHLEVSRDFLKNYSEGKTKVGPLEINLNVDMVIEATEIPRTRNFGLKPRNWKKKTGVKTC